MFTSNILFLSCRLLINLPAEVTTFSDFGSIKGIHDPEGLHDILIDSFLTGVKFTLRSGRSAFNPS